MTEPLKAIKATSILTDDERRTGIMGDDLYEILEPSMTTIQDRLRSMTETDAYAEPWMDLHNEAADRIDALEKALRERDMAALAEDAVAAGVSRSSFAQEAEYEHDRAALGEGE